MRHIWIFNPRRGAEYAENNKKNFAVSAPLGGNNER